MRSGDLERYPELRELVTFSPAWYWVLACAHVAAYPRLDRRSCDNLFLEIDMPKRCDAAA